MNSIRKFAVSASLVLAIGTSMTACSSQPGDADVLQYGYYTPAHVYVPYPTPHVVHVNYTTYHSDSRMYSTPSFEKTYAQTHTVVRTTTTTTTRTTRHR